MIKCVQHKHSDNCKDVAISGSTDCHVTGLPYDMSKNACKDHWTLGGGDAGFDNNDTRIYLNHSTNNSATLNIHAPSSINVTLSEPIFFPNIPEKIDKLGAIEVASKPCPQAS